MDNTISLNDFMLNFSKMAEAEDLITDILTELPNECQFAILADMIGIFCTNNEMPIKETYDKMADIALNLNTVGLYNEFKGGAENDY